MVSYILRFRDKTEERLWKSFKERAKAEGRSLRFVLLALIERYVEHGL